MSKKRKLSAQPRRKAGPGGGPAGGPKAKNGPQRKDKGPPPKKTKTAQKQPPPPLQPPMIPFSPTDRILLVGEGDLSFAASLLAHHSCTSVTATVLEPGKSALLAKYPHAEPNISAFEAASSPPGGRGGSGGGCKLLYNTDATKMTPFTTGRGPARRGAMDRVIFNFPHVGGKSTDVNRQVRYNQDLLVSFFGRVEPSLAPGGTVVVTLFEGEPYTLWNIRDLGRHCGFQVERSFRFRPEAYPGYSHARTLGVVKNKKGESGGGWKGEDRLARSYVFVRKGEEARMPVVTGKRKRDGEASDGEGDGSGDEDESFDFDSDFEDDVHN